MRSRRGEPRRGTQAGIELPPNVEIIYGKNAVREALRAGKRVRRLFVAQGAAKDEAIQEMVRLARGRGLWHEDVTREQLDAFGAEHQGVAAAVAPFPYESWGDLLGRLNRRQPPPAVLLLDTVQDPQNLGSLMRTSEAVGIDAIVLPKRRAVHVTPAVVRSSAGAVEHLSVAQVPNLARAAQELKDVGIWVAGIDMEGDQLYWDLDMSGPTALVLGGEDRGIGQLVKEHCDFLIRLPMKGNVSSLNAAVAGSIVLYELLRQRTSKQ
ncbi:MAG: 23S rRNA (guanosine(2251)-2'-O)-methyltransferase RlmB [Chloroflexota bacterium]